MEPTRVVIVSSHSLFAEGVASRLQQFPNRVDIETIDPQEDQFFNHIINIQPPTVIMEATNIDTDEGCLLCNMMSVLPTVKIIRLAAEQKDIQVIRSEQYAVKGVRDLIFFLEQPE